MVIRIIIVLLLLLMLIACGSAPDISNKETFLGFKSLTTLSGDSVDSSNSQNINAYFVIVSRNEKAAEKSLKLVKEFEKEADASTLPKFVISNQVKDSIPPNWNSLSDCIDPDELPANDLMMFFLNNDPVLGFNITSPPDEQLFMQFLIKAYEQINEYVSVLKGNPETALSVSNLKNICGKRTCYLVLYWIKPLHGENSIIEYAVSAYKKDNNIAIILAGEHDESELAFLDETFNTKDLFFLAEASLNDELTKLAKSNYYQPANLVYYVNDDGSLFADYIGSVEDLYAYFN